MKRVIKNIVSLDDDLRERLENQYPNGIRREDLISFPTPQGRRLYGIELRTGEINYLIRVPSIHSLSERGLGPRIDYLLKKTSDFEEEYGRYWIAGNSAIGSFKGRLSFKGRP